MPLVRIQHPEAALPIAQKRALAASITEIVLEAEVDAVTDMGRSVTIVQFQEVRADDWSLGGVLRSESESKPDHFLVDVYVLDGLLDAARRATVYSRITRAFQDAFAPLGENPMLPLRVWVLIHEVPEGCWGTAGTAVSALDVARFINPELAPERLRHVTEYLEKSERKS
jgi:phenylpyruvate tautomerase PptA (4-oxalocrotonate tautomerase family)